MAAKTDDGQLPEAWSNVVVGGDGANAFLLRPNQFLAAPEDAGDVQEHLPPGWARDDRVKSRSAVRFVLANGTGTAAEVVAALEEVRAATADRPRGPAKVGPNHVLVGEQAAVTFTGEPRIQGGNATCARAETPPRRLPHRTLQASDGKGVTVAVLDTGLFKNRLLPAGQIGGSGQFADTWDLDRDGFGDAEAGHGTFVSGLVLQVAPAAGLLDVKVLDSHGVGDDLVVAQAIEQLPPTVQIVNLSLGGYTEDDAAPLAVARALRAVRARGGVIVAAAGNSGQARPFWPAAFKQVLGVGAADLDGRWTRPDWSNYGYWVDVVTRGSNVASTYATAKTRFVEKRGDPESAVAFEGWARWDGTSFATPVVAGYLARLMTRNALANAQAAVPHLLANPPAPQPDFPLAVLVDDLEGGVALP
jgi:hypothetical protein